MHILITGAFGMLGRTLAKHFSHVPGITLSLTSSRKDDGLFTEPYLSFDLTSSNYGALQKFCTPNIIIHCAALTDHQACEQNPDLANSVNAQSGLRLARAFPHASIYYISTDAVYAPEVTCATENSPTRPLGVYGQSKLAGEHLLLEYTSKVTVLRTTVVGFSVFPCNKLNFAHWLAVSLTKQERISLYDNVFFSPLSSMHFAAHLEKILPLNLPSILNLSGAETCSRWKFGLALASVLRLDTSLINLIKLPEDPTRRMDQCLNSTHYMEITGNTLPGVDETVKSLASEWRTFYEKHTN